MPPPALLPGGPGGSGPRGQAGATEKPGTVADFAKREAESKGDVGQSRGGMQKQLVDDELKHIPADRRNDAYADALRRAKEQNENLDQAAKNYRERNLAGNQQGKLGVDLAEASSGLRSQDRLTQTASRAVNGRNVVEVGGVWIDDKFQAKTNVIAVKAQSDAYFRILERQPKMRDVFRLGNYVVWIAPNGSALVVDQNDGKEKLADEEIDRLFAVK